MSAASLCASAAGASVQNAPEGSPAMNCLLYTSLACTKAMSDMSGLVRIYPLPHMPVVKDLVPDLTNFYAQHASIKPWLQTVSPTPQKEWKQSHDDRQKLDGLYELSLIHI